jgi:hypothetical protein
MSENTTQHVTPEVALFLAEQALTNQSMMVFPWMRNVLRVLIEQARKVQEPELAPAPADRFPRIVEIEAIDLTDSDAAKFVDAQPGTEIEFVNGATGEPFMARLVDSGEKAFTLVEDTSAVIVIRFGG